MADFARWVKVEVAAPVIDMNCDQVYRAIREGKFPFPFVRIGKQIRIDAVAIGLLPVNQLPIQLVEASAQAA